ncbi:ABC transporter permease [Ruania alkalisoli]|uniref:Transport permease protein n=1 Tax=Ruania alkalisoli TaxID=2779775 RepID=A0A7M1SWU7_9MICO|nr:ABC transporter permease [Ruania alkalisoli]QOR72066.1 ABC transporter permease [Ruania alkalisoli]
MTTTATRVRRVPRGFGRLLATETRLFARDRGSVFFALAFPALVLIGVGLVIPGMDTVITEPGPLQGYQTIVVMLPAVLATAMATPALTTLPVTLATYREQGILTRLSTTPMPPAGVLAVHLLIGVVAFVVAAAVAVALAAVVFGVPAPASLLVTVLGLVLGAVAIFAVGLVVASRAGKGSTAQALGMLLYFPMLFFAGLWTPRPIMPDGVAAVAAWTPLGAASQAIEEGWFTTEVPWQQLAVLVLYAIVGLLLARRLFHWR